MRRWLLENLVPLVVAPLYYLYSLTWRLRITGDTDSLRRFIHSKKREAVVFAHWHGDELVLLPFYSYRRLAVLSSLSKDGTIMAKILKILGYEVFRGSSSRGGARALLSLIQKVKEGSQASLAVDGPKGPIYEVKPGIIELAMRSRKPIVVCRVFAKNVWYIPRAWNKSYVPKPFSKVEVYFSAPLSELPPALPRTKQEREEVVATAAALVKKELSRPSS